MKKRIKRIVIIVVIVLVVVSALLTIPSTSVDIKVFGDKYKYHLYDKYISELRHNVYISQLVYNENARYYDDYYDWDELRLKGIPADKEGKDKLIDYDGRKLYITVKCEYKGKKIDIKFEGTKIIGDVYTWKMFKNELFPIPDSSVEPFHEMEYV